MNLRQSIKGSHLTRYAPWLFLFGSALTLVSLGTRWAPWGYSDGVGYLVSARNLAEGVGLGLVLPSGSFEPLVSHPPLYPALLALLYSLGFDAFTAARLIDGFSFVTFILLSGYLLYRSTDDQLLSLSYAALLAFAPGVVLIFLSAMAEPLFFALGFPGLLLFALSLQSDRAGLRMVSALLIGAGVAARYPAISMVAAGVIALVLVKGFKRNSLVDAAIFSGLALLPTSLFLILTQLATAAASPRALAAGESTASLAAFARQSLNVLWSWKPLPPSAVSRALLGFDLAAWLPYTLIPLILIGFLLLLPWQLMRQESPVGAQPPKRKGFRPLVLVLVSFTVAYLGLLLAAYFGTYPTPDIDFRTLLPLLPALLLLAVLGLVSLRELAAKRFIPTLGFIIVIGSMVLGYMVSTAELVLGHYRTGAGYTSRAWQQAETIKRLNLLPADVPLVSNHPEPVLLYGDRYPHDLNTLLEASDQLPETCPEGLISLVQEQGAVVILFKLTGDPSQRNLNYQDTKMLLKDKCGVNLIQEFEDGSFLGTAAFQS